MRRLILGTAGHVDHGKTELVRALTGRETDRLKEEKARGISIELGFAPLQLSDDVFVGLIDVPGHERFVKQMVSGAGGLDMAMLLIAADEGVMPQTQEHLEVLTSLQLQHGVVVVSKSDLATPETRELLQEEISDLLDGTFLEHAPVVHVSARTGDGISALQDALLQVAHAVPERKLAGWFRLPVDRVFVREGIGTVVTGSAYSGQVAMGDTLQHWPSGRSVRVRDLQSFNDHRERAGAGERLAIALQGIKRDEISRGDVLTSPDSFSPSHVVDARVEVASYDDFVVKNRERVRIHHGAREVMGRVVLLEADELVSGQSGLAQLVLESPVVSAPGDTLVIRKYSPMRVCGGGVVIDPTPERHRRNDIEVIQTLRVREQGDPSALLLQKLVAGGFEGAPLAECDQAELAALTDSGEATTIGKRAYASDAVARLAAEIEDTVAPYLAEYPLRWGMSKEELKKRLQVSASGNQYGELLAAAAVHRPIFVQEDLVRIGDQAPELGDETTSALEALATFIGSCSVAFPARSDCASHWTGSGSLDDALGYLARAGRLVDFGAAGVMDKGAFEQCLSKLGALFDENPEVGVPVFKDALGVTRKHAIPILEYCDAQNYTHRREGGRVRGGRFPV